MSKHVTASKRKNRRKRGQAIDSGFGAPGNLHRTPKNYRPITWTYQKSFR